MHMIRKGQTRGVSGSHVRRQIQFINKLFEVAAWDGAWSTQPVALLLLFESCNTSTPAALSVGFCTVAIVTPKARPGLTSRRWPRLSQIVVSLLFYTNGVLRT